MGAVVVASLDEAFVAGLVSAFSVEALAARGCTSADDAVAAVDGAEAAVLVVDARMSHPDAAALCARARAASSAVWIVVIADRSAADPVDFLDRGADVWVAPGRQRELVARVRAMLRRAPQMVGGGGTDGALVVGDVVLDQERHEVTVAGRPVKLPLKQFQLLELFLLHPAQVLTRATILRRVWGADALAESNTLEVQIKRLRAQIEDDPSAPARIKTVRGLGYMYAADR